MGKDFPYVPFVETELKPFVPFHPDSLISPSHALPPIPTFLTLSEYNHTRNMSDPYAPNHY
jgi:hypothetical protein